MQDATPYPGPERQFARIDVRMNARFGILDEAQAKELESTVREHPSVWTTREESTLRSLASGTHQDSRGDIARAVLEISEQVARLTYRVLGGGGPLQAATIVQLSGGGGRIMAEPILKPGACLDLRLEDDEAGAPPVRALVRVVHAGGPRGYGFRFAAINAADQDRLIRYIYQIQREALRKAQIQEP